MAHLPVQLCTSALVSCLNHRVITYLERPAHLESVAVFEDAEPGRFHSGRPLGTLGFSLGLTEVAWSHISAIRSRSFVRYVMSVTADFEIIMNHTRMRHRSKGILKLCF